MKINNTARMARLFLFGLAFSLLVVVVIMLLPNSAVLAAVAEDYTPVIEEIKPADPDKVYPIEFSESQWRARLSAFEYKVLRQEGTEYAFTGALNNEKRKGIYYSRATGQPLFASEHKYDSRTGWPSFWRPIDDKALDYIIDNKLFLTRIEVTDSSSGSHLGHVFEDGPPPTGLRYCINSVALIFVPEGEEPPQLVADYLQKNSPDPLY